MKINSFNRYVFIAGVIVYMAAAYIGTGYFHADEHYQIIEFANSRIQDYAANEYAWEFEAASRSAIQPMMAYWVFAFCKWISVTDPYMLAFLLRALTGITALLAIRSFTRAVSGTIEPGFRKVFLIASYFLWFLPLVNVRFSSEVWAGIALVFAAAILVDPKKKELKHFFLIGLLLAFSFLFRFQLASVGIGIFLWLIAIRRPGLKAVLLFCLGYTSIFLTGILIDRWFYGKWVLSSWNYFDLQILQSVAAGFGTTPWHEYLSVILRYPSLPIGIIILISTCWFLIFKPKHVITWILVSFMLLHFFVGHKEERFLFPLVNFVPFIAICFFQWISHLKVVENRTLANKKRMALLLLIPLLAVNLVGLTAVLSKSAGSGGMAVTEYIHDHYRNKRVKLIHSAYSSPYSPFESVPVKFYLDNNVGHLKINGFWELNDSILQPRDSIVLVAIRYPEMRNPDCARMLGELRLTKVKAAVPGWIIDVNNFYHCIDTNAIVELYRRN